MRREIEADAVVVGSGMSGVMAASVIASVGRHVTLLERGEWLSAERIRSIHERTSFRRTSVPTLEIRKREGRKQISRPYPISVGGLANFYQAVSLRMRREEFRAWPFSYEELEPFYSRAETLLRVAGRAGVDPTEPSRSRPYPCDLPAIGGHAPRIYDAATKLGMRPFQHPLAIEFARGCRLCEHCNQVPCPFGVKFSPALFLAQRGDRAIEVHDGTEANRLHVTGRNGGRRVDWLLATRGAEEVRYRARTFVLCGGALLTPKLLHNSGFSESHPLLGTHFMSHCIGVVWGIYWRPLAADPQFDKFLSVSDFYFDERGQVRGLIQQEQRTSLTRMLESAEPLARPFVRAFHPRHLALIVLAEDEPRLENRLELGIEDRICFVQRFSAADEQRRAFLMKKARRILKAAGAALTIGTRSHSVYHACGTCRMGCTAETSVVDPIGRVWGTENLFVADASIMPTSSGVNPSLTVAANALRVATHAC